MRCLKCGRFLGIIQRFCSKCGTAVTAEQKKKGLITLGVWTLLFLLFVPVSYYFLSQDSRLQGQTNLYIFSFAAFLSLIAVEIIALVRWFVTFVVRSTIRQPVLSSIVIGAIVILVGFGLYVYRLDVNDKKFSDSLDLIQENLNEAATAKIMGDSIIAKKPIPGSSMARVRSTAELVVNVLEFMDAPEGLKNYRRSVTAWSQAIANAAEDNKTWGSVSDHPEDFKLKLSQKQSEIFFQDSIKKITELKEFGDSAIERKDRTTMVYIAAKLVTQEHWLNGILHSETSGLFSLNNLVSPALAFSFGDGVPDVGPSGDVTCQVCNDPNIHWTAELRRQYNCDTKCGGLQQQQQNQEQQQNQQNDEQDERQDEETDSNWSTPFVYGDMPVRKICIGNNVGGVFCVEDAIQSTNEIGASTINFTEGEKGAEDDWNDGWHREGGLGVIGGNPTNSSEHSTLQAFYDSCQNNGGLIGGTGTIKSGLPTTESGYTCEYKINDKNGASIPCWDFLTYSGGRYMGGNDGCQEKNLLPEIDEETLRDKTAGLGGKWDGNYAVSGTTIKCSGDFAYSIPVPATTAPVRNNIMSSTQGPIPINGNSVVWTMSISTQQENATVNVSEIDTFRFYQSGNVTGVGATYNANITIVTEDQIKISTCYGAIGGVRQ